MDEKILQSLLFSHTQICPAKLRESYADKYTEEVNKNLDELKINKLPLCKGIETHVDELKKDGITFLGSILSDSQINDLLSKLADKNIYDGHVWRHGSRKPSTITNLKKNGILQASYALNDVIDIPNLLETANNEKVLSIAQEYLGCLPTIYSMNLMWNFQSPQGTKGVAQNFHREWDSMRFCALFVYLTDSDSSIGTHQYIKQTHKPNKFEALIKKHNNNSSLLDFFCKKNPITEDVFYDTSQGYGWWHCEDVFKDLIVSVNKPKGFAFLADPFGLQRGVPPITSDQLIFCSRYGIYNNGFVNDVSPNQNFEITLKNKLPIDNKSYNYLNRVFLR